MKNYLPSLLVFVLLNFAVCAVAEEKSSQPGPSSDRLKKSEVFEGKIACIGCFIQTLDPESNPQCTLHSKHAQGLITGDGSAFTILDNSRGHLLITNPKWKGKEMKIRGWKFPKTQMIEISKFQLKDGEKWVDYDFCKSCGFEPGDNKGKDTCEGCGEH